MREEQCVNFLKLVVKNSPFFLSFFLSVDLILAFFHPNSLTHALSLHLALLMPMFPKHSNTAILPQVLQHHTSQHVRQHVCRDVMEYPGVL